MFQIKSTTIFGGDQGVKTELISASVRHDLSLGIAWLNLDFLTSALPSVSLPVPLSNGTLLRGSEAKLLETSGYDRRIKEKEGKIEKRGGEAREGGEKSLSDREGRFVGYWLSSLPSPGVLLVFHGDIYLLLCLVSIFWNCLSNII